MPPNLEPRLFRRIVASVPQPRYDTLMSTVTLADFSANTISGEPVSLAKYRGQVVLIVNTASQCGFTPQYAGIEALQAKYGPQGFVVLGFPCNQFGSQEPGAADEIATFCETQFGVSFPMMEKVDVKGDHAHPLFTWLSDAQRGVLGSRAIKWNFTKFLIGRDGRPIARFAPQTAPLDLAPDIEAALRQQ